jgi:hypothetical protein
VSRRKQEEEAVQGEPKESPESEEPNTSGDAPESREGEGPREVLVVISKLKKYIRARSGMNTSDGVIPVLSDHLRKLCEDAIANASREGRKTVMDRDFRA